ncbi:MAG: guanylate kinase [Acidimicrobiia bacterium]|nr:guanylate kinase [Acidimicrobiia bacterium]
MIAGPSGAGKSTIVRRLLAHRPFRFSVSVTTRAPRPGEVDGVHYHFVTVEEFRAMVDHSELLEWAEYGTSLYGTPLGPVLDVLEGGEDMLLEIEVQGAALVREVYPEALMIFVRAPSLTELARRLRERGDTTDEAIERRLEIARHELAIADALFDYVVVNEDLDATLAQVLDILDGRRRRPQRST